MNLKDKHVLVTGGRGFLGKHVVNLLKKRGAIVSLAPHDKWDLVRQDAAMNLIEITEPEVIIHCAAKMGGIGANRAEPGAFFYENLMMGANVLEAARHFEDVRKVVMIGTVCSYPKNTPVPFCEHDLWNGYPEETNGPYGVAKKALITMAGAYRAQYALNAISLLMTNMYGPGDNFDLQTSHVIPALIRKIAQAKYHGEDSITLWGDGTPTRDFLYVEDAAEAVVLAAEHYDEPEPVNVASGTAVSMKALSMLVSDMMQYEGRVLWDTSKPNGQPARRLDVTKAQSLFGFSAHTTLELGLKSTIAWWNRIESGYAMTGAL